MNEKYTGAIYLIVIIVIIAVVVVGAIGIVSKFSNIGQIAQLENLNQQPRESNTRLENELDNSRATVGRIKGTVNDFRNSIELSITGIGTIEETFSAIRTIIEEIENAIVAMDNIE